MRKRTANSLVAAQVAAAILTGVGALATCRLVGGLIPLEPLRAAVGMAIFMAWAVVFALVADTVENRLRAHLRRRRRLAGWRP